MKETKNSGNFKALKLLQYCDNEDCAYCGMVGAGNIRTHSRTQGQVYCALCKNRWVVTRDSFYYGLKTPPSKIVETLLLLAGGTGLRKTCRIQGITPKTANFWMEKAMQHKNEFNRHMKQKMQLTNHQIKKIWAFLEKKII